MAPVTTREAQEIERWNRISTLVRAACAVVERAGTEVLIKFDGARDNDKIYTVVLDFGGVASSREDSSDLEETLSRLFGTGISGATSPTEEFAERLRSFDLLAKRGFVVGLVILRDGAHLAFEVFLSRNDRTFEPMQRRGKVFAEVADETIRYAGQTS
jgi:hypothetical protein